MVEVVLYWFASEPAHNFLMIHHFNPGLFDDAWFNQRDSALIKLTKYGVVVAPKSLMTNGKTRGF